MTPRRAPRLVMPLRERRGAAPAGAPWPERLLHALGANPAFADAVLGDLAEERARREEQEGPLAARWWYASQALRSAPHFLLNAVRHGGPSGRARVAALIAMVALVPTVAVIAILLRGAPARLVVDGQGGGEDGGIVLNTVHPVQLAMRVLDAKGRDVPSAEVHYRWTAGIPIPVSPSGVVTCSHPGDATVQASVGSVETTVLLRCRPVSELRARMWMRFVAGDSGQDLVFFATGPDGLPVSRLAGELRVHDSSIATLKGTRIHPLAPGHTFVTMSVGDGEARTRVSVYEPVPSLHGLRADQRYVVAPVRLARGDSIRWPLPEGLFWLHYTRALDAQPIPALAVEGPVMCMPDFGPEVERVSCLVRGPGASIRIAHPGAAEPMVAGRLALEHHQ